MWRTQVRLGMVRRTTILEPVTGIRALSPSHLFN
jgi:hypothetical protein